jgi:hypothetical protein
LEDYAPWMTEVNGLRLAYRGFVAGIAGGYVWAAIAMTLAGIAFGDPLRPLRPFAEALLPVALTPELAFVTGLGAVQAGGALIGMCFAYFFGRFFTVRATVAAAGPCFALLVWGLVGAVGLAGRTDITLTAHPIAVLAAIGFGLLLGAAVPLRGEVVRYSRSGPGSGSPVT